MNDELLIRAKEIIQKLDVASKQKQMGELEVASQQADFWKDHNTARVVMKKIDQLRKTIDEAGMIELMIDGGEEVDLEKEVNRLEFALYLSGPYDSGDAILALHAGQGGTEAMDWTQMLYRMYARYIERKGWASEILDETMGEEAGIKSITLQVEGEYAYGFLKAEAGVHRLVRQSPFNADKLRQTSFAMAEVLPVLEDTAGIELKDEELEWDFYRSGGKGGQNVNKVSTAVRLRHIPTNIVVTCQTQRQQGQNRESALNMLRAKLWTIQEEKRRSTETKLRGVYKTPGWGNQIRSYVLHPYHMVKDVRTGVEVNNTDIVLDGDLDQFVNAYLKKFG